METSKKIKIAKMLRAIMLISIISITLVECKKDTLETTLVNNTPANNPVTYSTLQDFFAQNGAQMQTVTIDAALGGTFTSPQGTVVTIPPNAFVTSGGAIITGNVTVDFKDIYSPADMILSNMPTQTANGPLVSGGEFFIDATINGTPVALAPGTNITVNQPSMGMPVDPGMMPYVFNTDSAVWQTPTATPITTTPTFTVGPLPGDTTWFNPTPGLTKPDSIGFTANGYIYQVLSLDPWAWHNADRPLTGSGFTTLTININNIDTTSIDYNTNVYLVFTGINSTVNIYQDWATFDFSYTYAPIGLQCTIVALSIEDGKVYSSFTPITIGTNQTVNVSITETTTDAFKTALDALN